MHIWYHLASHWVWYNQYISHSWLFTAVSPVSFAAIKEWLCSVLLDDYFSTNAELSMIDFVCWRQSTLINFTSRWWQSTYTGRFRWWSTHLPILCIHCSWPSRSDGYSDRLPTFQQLIWYTTHATAANQVENEKIVLYSSLSSEIDYKSLMAEHTASFADYRCQISSMLLGSLC